IVIGSDVAATRAGQICALALANMTARVHRRVGVVVPPAPLLARSLVPAADFPSALVATMRAINPVLDLDIGGALEAEAYTVSVGIGAAVPPGLTAYVGWQGGRGELSDDPIVGSEDRPDAMFGPATAAVLAAAALFRLAYGQPVEPLRFNPVELSAGAGAGVR